MADRVRWINKGSTQRMFGKIIKPNQVFLAHADEIPMALRSVILLVDPIVIEPTKPAAVVPTAPVEAPVTTTPVEAPVTTTPVVEQVSPAAEVETEKKPERQVFPRRTLGQPGGVVFKNYSLRERSPGWFDVIDSTGKVVNEQPQTELEARDLIKRLG